MTEKGFDFDIIWVCRQLGLPISLRNTRSFNMDCPFCGRQGKLNINVEKNAFRCPACDEHGGMLRLYQLIRVLSDTKEAYKELYDIFNGNKELNLKDVQIRKRNFSQLPQPVEVSDIKTRNDTYTEFLNMCHLSLSHKADLLKRGLSEEAIVRGQYKSVPQVGFMSIPRTLEKNGYSVVGVPGFYSYKGYVKIPENRSGFFVPVRNIHGQISGMQIRFDDGHKRKYIWFTSNNFPKGCSVSGIEQIHYAGIRYDNVPRVIGITEGPLKADIAYELLGIPFIAVIGVANLSQLKENLIMLKKLGVEEVNELFDMDYFENKNVKKFVDKAHEIIKSVGFNRVVRRKWNVSYKGIDDFALARAQGKVIEKSDFLKKRQ